MRTAMANLTGIVRQKYVCILWQQSCNRRDGNGNAWEDVKKWFSKRWNAFKNFVGNTFGNEKTSVFVEDSTPAVDISNLIPASMTVGNRTSTQKKPFSKSKPIMTYGQVRGDFILPLRVV